MYKTKSDLPFNCVGVIHTHIYTLFSTLAELYSMLFSSTIILALNSVAAQLKHAQSASGRNNPFVQPQ